MSKPRGGFFSHSSVRLTGEELSARRRRTVITAGGVLITILLLGAGAAIYPRLRDARLFTMARGFTAAADLRNAELSYRQILAANPGQVQAAREFATLLESSGRPDALDLRRKVVKLETGYLKNSADWIYSALKFGNLPQAEEALFEVDEAGKKTGLYHHLASVLAAQWRQNHRSLTNAMESVRLDPSNESFQINLGARQLLSTNPAVRADGGARLGKINSGPGRIEALRAVVAGAEKNAEYKKAADLAAAVARATMQPSDEMRHGELLLKADPRGFEQWLSDWLASLRTKPAEQIGAASWLVNMPFSPAALRWARALPPEIKANWEVNLLLARSLMAQSDWKAAAEALKNPWKTNDVLRQALFAEVEGRDDPAKSASIVEVWVKAMSDIPSSELLLRFLPPSRAAQFLDAAAQSPASARWALNQIRARATESGDSVAALEAVRKMARLDPGDDHLRNSVNKLSLLVGRDLNETQSSAGRLQARHPDDPAFATTQACSLFLQNRRAEGIRTLLLLPEFQRELPPVALWLGILYAADRQHEKAAEYLNLVDGVPMTPEEKLLVAKAWEQVEDAKAAAKAGRK